MARQNQGMEAKSYTGIGKPFMTLSRFIVFFYPVCSYKIIL